MFLAYGNVDSVAYGAALPYHVEHFAIGGASYWLYERRSKLARADGWFILACVTAGSIYLLRGSILSRSLIPIILWIVFLGLVLEQPSSRAHRLLSPFFTHPAVRYLGSISFSVYLSHMLVISLVQFVLLETVPELDRSTHVAILLVATLAAALPISIALHRHVEVPGIAFGRRVAERLGAGRPARTPDTAFRDGRSTDMPIPGWPARE
jgi:peptidoglycan/LPS O-acetylase OafA/YrhL